MTGTSPEICNVDSGYHTDLLLLKPSFDNVLIEHVGLPHVLPLATLMLSLESLKVVGGVVAHAILETPQVLGLLLRLWTRACQYILCSSLKTWMKGVTDF